MMPSIELRLATMVRALEEVIVPAIAPGNDLAREQAQLLIAHLGLLGQHWQRAHRYDDLSCVAMLALAHRLATAAAGGTQTVAAAAALSAVIQSHDIDMQDSAARQASLAAAIDGLVSACGLDGAPAFRALLFSAIADHGAAQAERDRVWFAGCGMDPDSASFASIDEMLARGV